MADQQASEPCFARWCRNAISEAPAPIGQEAQRAADRRAGEAVEAMNTGRRGKLVGFLLAGPSITALI
jgi:hypothetical protein